MLLNLFPVSYLRLELDLMHLLRMCRDYCHFWNKQHWKDSKFAWMWSCFNKNV